MSGGIDWASPGTTLRPRLHHQNHLYCGFSVRDFELALLVGDTQLIDPVSGTERGASIDSLAVRDALLLHHSIAHRLALRIHNTATDDLRDIRNWWPFLKNCRRCRTAGWVHLLHIRRTISVAHHQQRE